MGASLVAITSNDDVNDDGSLRHLKKTVFGIPKSKKIKRAN